MPWADLLGTNGGEPTAGAQPLRGSRPPSMPRGSAARQAAPQPRGARVPEADRSREERRLPAASLAVVPQDGGPTPERPAAALPLHGRPAEPLDLMSLEYNFASQVRHTEHEAAYAVNTIRASVEAERITVREQVAALEQALQNERHNNAVLQQQVAATQHDAVAQNVHYTQLGQAQAYRANEELRLLFSERDAARAGHARVAATAQQDTQEAEARLQHAAREVHTSQEALSRERLEAVARREALIGEGRAVIREVSDKAERTSRSASRDLREHREEHLVAIEHLERRANHTAAEARSSEAALAQHARARAEQDAEMAKMRAELDSLRVHLKTAVDALDQQRQTSAAEVAALEAKAVEVPHMALPPLSTITSVLTAPTATEVAAPMKKAPGSAGSTPAPGGPFVAAGSSDTGGGARIPDDHNSRLPAVGDTLPSPIPLASSQSLQGSQEEETDSASGPFQGPPGNAPGGGGSAPANPLGPWHAAFGPASPWAIPTGTAGPPSFQAGLFNPFTSPSPWGRPPGGGTTPVPSTIPAGTQHFHIHSLNQDGPFPSPDGGGHPGWQQGTPSAGPAGAGAPGLQPSAGSAGAGGGGAPPGGGNGPPNQPPSRYPPPVLPVRRPPRPGRGRSPGSPDGGDGGDGDGGPSDGHNSAGGSSSSSPAPPGNHNPDPRRRGPVRCRNFTLPAFPKVQNYRSWLTRVRKTVSAAAGEPRAVLDWLKRADPSKANLPFESLSNPGLFERVDFTLSAQLLALNLPNELSAEIERRDNIEQQSGSIVSGLQTMWIIGKHFATKEEAGAMFLINDLTAITMPAGSGVPELKKFHEAWSSTFTEHGLSSTQELMVARESLLGSLRNCLPMAFTVSTYDSMDSGDPRRTHDWLFGEVRRLMDRIHADEQRSRKQAAFQKQISEIHKSQTTQRGTAAPVGSGGSTPAANGGGGSTPAPGGGGKGGQGGGKGKGKGKGHCWNWIAGRCERGPSCSFQHDPAMFNTKPGEFYTPKGGGKGGPAATPVGAPPGQPAPQPTANSGPAPPQRKLCPHHRKGTCSAGSSCPMSHNMDEWIRARDTQRDNQRERALSATSDGASDGTAPTTPKRRSRRRKASAARGSSPATTGDLIDLSADEHGAAAYGQEMGPC